MEAAVEETPKKERMRSGSKHRETKKTTRPKGAGG
jgi:hypothetical protein